MCCGVWVGGEEVGEVGGVVFQEQGGDAVLEEGVCGRVGRMRGLVE